MIGFNKITSIVASICFSITLYIYIYINNSLVNLISTKNGFSEQIIIGLSAISLYAVLFTTIFWIYKKFIHVKIYPKYDLAGEWYHINHVQTEYRESDQVKRKEKVRHGITSINVDFDEGINFSVENIKLPKVEIPFEEADSKNLVFIENIMSSREVSSLWTSEASSIKNKIFVLFNSDSITHGFKMRRGTMILSSSGEKCPNILKGIWSYVAPAKSRGTIIFYKNKKDYIKALNKIIRSGSSNDESMIRNIA